MSQAHDKLMTNRLAADRQNACHGRFGASLLRPALAARGGRARACSRVCAWLTWEKSLRIEVVALANSGPLEFSRGSLATQTLNSPPTQSDISEKSRIRVTAS